MYADLFDNFLTSSDTFRVYKGSKLLFASKKEGLQSWCEYFDRFVSNNHPVVAFDKIMGNAAALLCVKANCKEVYSPLGSRLAADTLEKYGIRYNLTQIAPYIRRAHSEEICPGEALSINKSPDEFYELIRKH